MSDGSISISHLVTGSLWGLMVIFGIAAWVVTIWTSHHVGALLGMTATCLAVGAGVSHIRCMINRATWRVRSAIDAKADRPGEPLRAMH